MAVPPTNPKSSENNLIKGKSSICSLVKISLCIFIKIKAKIIFYKRNDSHNFHFILYFELRNAFLVFSPNFSRKFGEKTRKLAFYLALRNSKYYTIFLVIIPALLPSV